MYAHVCMLDKPFLTREEFTAIDTCMHADIYLDGVLQNNIIEVDDVAGLIVKYADTSVTLDLFKGFVIETLHGHVQIVDRRRTYDIHYAYTRCDRG